MTTQDDDAGLDPRFDPIFQRGYSGASTGRIRSVDAAHPSNSAHPADLVLPVDSARPVTESVPVEDALDPWPDSTDDANEYEEETSIGWAPYRRPLLTLWCIGLALILIGVLAMAGSIQINLQMSSGISGDSPLFLAAQICWALTQPTLVVGLATLVGALAIHLLTPARRGRQ